jgi:hypothetical protein
MRASQVRAAIVAAVEDTVADSPMHPGDYMRHIDLGSDDPATAPDRSFSVQLAAQPKRIEASSCDLFQVEYLITVFYAAAQPGVQDRMADDAERIHRQLDWLHEASEDICRCDVSPFGLQPVEPEVILSQFSVVVVYRLDAAVLQQQ